MRPIVRAVENERVIGNAELIEKKAGLRLRALTPEQAADEKFDLRALASA